MQTNTIEHLAFTQNLIKEPCNSPFLLDSATIDTHQTAIRNESRSIKTGLEGSAYLVSFDDVGLMLDAAS